MPNFISIKMPVGKRQDGMKSTGIDVAELTKEQAEEYAELMKESFIKHWQNKVNQPVAGAVVRQPVSDVPDFIQDNINSRFGG